MRTTFLLIICAAIITLLASCADQPGKPAPSEGARTLSSAERIQRLLTAAQNSASPQRERKQLKAAALLLAEQQRDLVEQIINRIQPEDLPLSTLARYAKIVAALNIQRGNYKQALLVLETPRLLDNLDALSHSKQLSLTLIRAEVFALLGSHIASAQQRIYIAPLLKEKDQQSNQQALWRSLMYVSKTDLKGYLQNTFRGEYQGWLELALIAKDNQGDLDEQIRQLENWQQQRPSHPANGNLPGGLELIKELATSRPQQVALLLPLTGKLAPYGKAIRDGFIVAMYQTRQRGGKVPQLNIYNTEESEDFISLYHRAINEGAELVVGPLEKQRLRLLFDEMSLPVPTLALNRIDDYGQAPEHLFQFGLAPQDEALQIADIAFLENHRQALIISPRGEWGDKISNTFMHRWDQLGGETTAQSIYSGQQDYSSSLKEALHLLASEKRAKRIGKLIGTHIEFLPRRRKDIDMVFLLARPQQARSIKPLLAYHYAGDIPVYGTSRLYAGFDDVKKDRDINGIRFTDMPWVLNKPSLLHQQISSEIVQSKQYQRMYALGIDSFQLHPRLRQLEEITNSRVYGQTGTLKLNGRKEIERQMLLAQIKGNRAKLIPTVDQSLNHESAR
ncbi:MAG: penicillin-binding protein activator [Pseudomonadales bacterium]